MKRFVKFPWMVRLREVFCRCQNRREKTVVVVVVVVVVVFVVVDIVVVFVVVIVVVVVMVVVVGNHKHVFTSPLISTYLRFPLTDFDQFLM